MRNNYCVAVYLADKAYGGPEEGGWWFDCGEMVKLIKVLHTEESAWAYAHRMQRLVDRVMNKGRRDIGSVLSEGIYDVQVHENVPPHHYPSVTPRYE